MLDANDEDPFTLESFLSVLELHAEKGIDCIIARVATSETSDTRIYHSYYLAHHINKVLFRTQPDEGLLHRMRAKNPLNNMTIVGDVHYFIIKPHLALLNPIPKSPYALFTSFIYPPVPPASRRILAVRERLGDANITTPLTFLIRQEAYESDFEEIEMQTRRRSFDDAYADDTPSHRPASQLKKNCPNRMRNVRSHAFANERTDSMTIEDWMRIKNLPSPDAIVVSATTRVIVDASPTRRRASPTSGGGEMVQRVLEARYYASDDDYLMHASVRAYFKANALEDQDHVLFTIQTQSVEEGGEVHPTLANLSLFLGNDESRSNSVFRRRLKWVVLGYGVFSFLILKFCGTMSTNLVPFEYLYISGFFLFFALCLFLIIAL